MPWVGLRSGSRLPLPKEIRLCRIRNLITTSHSALGGRWPLGAEQLLNVSASKILS
jgi:hypothetical protein